MASAENLASELRTVLRQELATISAQVASADNLASELRTVLRHELAPVRDKLDKLSQSQAVLASVVENIDHKNLPSHANSAPDKIANGNEGQDVEDIDLAMVRPRASSKNGVSTTTDEGPEACAKLSNILPSCTNPEPDKVVDNTGLQNDGKSIDKVERNSSASLKIGLERNGTALPRRNRTSTMEDEGAVEFSRLYNMWRKETQQAEEEATHRRESSLVTRLSHSPNIKQVILDQIVSVIVLLNAVFIGIFADLWNGEINIYYLIDTMFCIVFVTELMAKFYLYGISELYCGKSKFSNLFDLLLVVSDAVQLIMVFSMKDAFKSMRDQGVPSFSLFRIVRVLRVARLLRIIRHRVFEDLLAMLEAVLSGVRTLTWAVVLYFLVIYVVALLCRDVLGNYPEYIEIYPYFNSVPRSVFTVFRCSFGDCSSANGQPIPEEVHKHFGTVYSICFCLLQFFIVIGLFNVISAIFVDRTMIHAARLEAKRTKEALMNERLWASKVSIFVTRCLEYMGREDQLDRLGDCSGFDIEIPVSVVTDVCHEDKLAINALLELGIDEYDHRNLAHILDADQSGSINLHQFVNGLQHMRGLPRRSDDVQSFLMLQRLQAKVEDVHRVVFSNNRVLYSSATRSLLSGAPRGAPGRAWE